MQAISTNVFEIFSFYFSVSFDFPLIQTSHRLSFMLITVKKTNILAKERSAPSLSLLKGTTIENPSIYRKNTIARKSQQDMNLINLEVPKNEMGDGGMKNSMILRSEMQLERQNFS